MLKRFKLYSFIHIRKPFRDCISIHSVVSVVLFNVIYITYLCVSLLLILGCVRRQDGADG